LKENLVGVLLNHSAVPVRDKEQSAVFMAEILGLDPPVPLGPFLCLKTANGVSLDFLERAEAGLHHYAFEVSDEDFDSILARVIQHGVRYWADPFKKLENEIHDRDHPSGDPRVGRNFYFEDPSGHSIEVLTAPFGT
jgi:catechol 2,3-dioxygenase-like lactoylglutathione lyase family enzyme